jgi:uracil-DNA glycosylase
MNFEDPQLLTSWKAFFKEQSTQTYYRQLLNFLEAEKNSGRVIYPSSEKVLRVFKETDYSKIKVVILGQDPYHGPSQANGLCFSVNPGVVLPPSLKNIRLKLCNH